MGFKRQISGGEFYLTGASLGPRPGEVEGQEGHKGHGIGTVERGGMGVLPNPVNTV